MSQNNNNAMTADMTRTNAGNLLLFGVNHKTAPVELREQIAVPPLRLAEATRSLAETPGVREAMILSTCNRVEAVVCADAAVPDLMGFFNRFFAVDHSVLRP